MYLSRTATAVRRSGIAYRTTVDGHRTLNIGSVSDALGLAAFASTGALVGTGVGLSPFGVVALATVTAVGGGSIADILLGRVPVVLREDFYATPALVGGVSFWILSEVGASAGLSTLVCTVSVLALRGLALTYDWQLPTV